MQPTTTITTTPLKGFEPVVLRAAPASLAPNGRQVKEVKSPKTVQRPVVELPDPPAPMKANRLRSGLIAALLIVGAAVATGYYVEFVAPFESTDDAFIEADVTAIAPQVSGRVAALRVEDNQMVHQGDVLLEIDPADYEARVDQARAGRAAAQSRLDQAKAQLSVDDAKVSEERANVVAAQAEASRSEADLKRYNAVGIGGISASQLDLAATRARSAAAEVEAARNKELAAEAQSSFDHARLATAVAELESSEAAVRQAELDLSYTKVTAPVSGRVTHRTVSAGAYVQPGQALLAIVPGNVWVIANFKETQLAHIRPGQPVAITMDAYPQVEFRGRVDSIQSGAGARFSLLPPENASGNYVKVVQRVPVKITLDQPADDRYVLGPGMSVEPEVRVN